MHNYDEAQKYFLSRWMRGTTCHGPCKQAIEWTDESGRFILMVHHSHACYCDRMTGSVTCGVYRSLYDLDKVKEVSSSFDGDKHLKKWEGRWKKEYVKEVMKIIKDIIEKENLGG